jgi:uncharacterized OsmC-like protein
MTVVVASPARKAADVTFAAMDLRASQRPLKHQATPVGFTAIRLRFAVDAPEATPEELASVLEKTERYCVVLQTVTSPPIVTVTG